METSFNLCYTEIIMNKKAEWNRSDKSVTSFLNAGAVPPKRPPGPTREQLDQRFTLTVSSKGRPVC